MKTTAINIFDKQEFFTKELLTNETKINDLLNQLKELENLDFDFSTKQGVEEAKFIKKQANKFVKKLKEFCDPLELEGKKVASTRSKITTNLITGKESIINNILRPAHEAEEQFKKLQSINLDFNTIDLCNKIIARCKELVNFDFLYLTDQANFIINSLNDRAIESKNKLEFLENERIRKEKERRRQEMDEEIERIEQEAKLKIDQEKEKNQKLQEQLKSEKLKTKSQDIQKKQTKTCLEKVHSEIKASLTNININSKDVEKIIDAIASKKIPYLKIEYN